MSEGSERSADNSGAEPGAAEPQLITTSEALVGRIARAVAHEINSPLTLVVTSLGCMRDDFDAGVAGDDLLEMREMVADAQEGATRVTDLLRTFRALARPVSDAVTRVDVNASLTKALDLVRRELEGGGAMDLRFGEPPYVSVKGGLLHAWVHLFIAIGDVLDHGVVRVQTDGDEREARVRIRFPARGWPGPLEPGLFHDAIADSDGRYEIGMTSGEALIEVTLPAG